MLSIAGDCVGQADGVEFQPVSGSDAIHCLAQHRLVEGPAKTENGVYGSIDNLVADRCQVVVQPDVAVDVGRPSGGECLRQLDLEIGESPKGRAICKSGAR